MGREKRNRVHELLSRRRSERARGSKSGRGGGRADHDGKNGQKGAGAREKKEERATERKREREKDKRTGNKLWTRGVWRTCAPRIRTPR